MNKMNPSQKPSSNRTREEIDREIEQMMREQGVEPFDFNAAVGEGADLWTDKEYEEFQIWLRRSRREDNPNRSKIG